jgi:hypothetical protein
LLHPENGWNPVIARVVIGAAIGINVEDGWTAANAPRT